MERQGGVRDGGTCRVPDAALCHVMLECIDDGKHKSAFMKNLEPVDVKACARATD